MNEIATTIHHALLTRLKVRHLFLLHEMSQHKTLSRVAYVLGLSQPALTKSLQEIEDIFAARLFDRTSRGLQLTAAGHEVLRYARGTLADTESAARILSAIDSGMATHLRIGIIPQLPSALLSRVVTHLLSRNPRVSLLVREGTTDDLVAALQARELDCGIGRAFDGHGGGVVQEPIYRQEPCVVVAASNRLRLTRGPLAWEKLVDLDWIFPPPNTPMRRSFNAVFVGAGIQPPAPILETVSLKAMATVLRNLPNSITIIARDMLAELKAESNCIAINQAFTWDLPPVTFFTADGMRTHPVMQMLNAEVRRAASDLGVNT